MAFTIYLRIRGLRAKRSTIAGTIWFEVETYWMGDSSLMTHCSIGGYVSIYEDAIENKLHKNKDYVIIPEEQGGGYLGNLEVYHQVGWFRSYDMACIWPNKSFIVWISYENLPTKIIVGILAVCQWSSQTLTKRWGNMSVSWTNLLHFLIPRLARTITKTIASIICASLSCALGTSEFIHTSGPKGRNVLFPDFRVERKCRDWNPLAEYAAAARGNITLPSKPEGVHEYDIM